jgi:cytochrome c oxidase cbb3-type subunit 3
MYRRFLLLLGIMLVVAVAVSSAGCGNSDATTTSVASPGTTSASGSESVSGSEVFATVCAGCHGADGTGGSGPDLTVRTGLTKDRIVDQVTNGGSRMPPYGDRLNSEEIGAVADFVLSDIVK